MIKHKKIDFFIEQARCSVSIKKIRFFLFFTTYISQVMEKLFFQGISMQR